MNEYSVRVYVGTAWSFLTQADHFEDFEFQSKESLQAFAKRLASEGFQSTDGKKWIMPAAILSVKEGR